MKYYESRLSQQLYSLNKRRIITEYFPWLYRDSRFVKIISIIYILRLCLRSILFSSYDKQISDVSEYKLKEFYDYNGHVPKIVVYTCITGSYDDLKEPFFTNDFLDFIVITDQEVSHTSKWKKLDISKVHCPNGLNNAQINRWVKMNPHKIFPEYDYSVYIDGSVNVVTDLVPLVLNLINSKKWFGIHLHSCRKKIKTEAKVLLSCKKVTDKTLMNKQIDKYYKDGFDDSIKLLEATILIREHNNTICKKIMEDWWQEFMDGVPRDQLSLPYILWKNNITMDDIYILGSNEYANPRFFINKHRVS